MRQNPFIHLLGTPSIEKKLRLMITITSTVAVLLACLVCLLYGQFLYRGQIKTTLVIGAQFIEEVAVLAIEFDQESDVDDAFSKAFEAVPELMNAAVYRTDGGLFATRSQDGAQFSAPATAPSGRFDGDGFNLKRREYVRDIYLDGEPKGSLYLQTSSEAEANFLRNWILFIVTVVLLISGMAWLLASRVQRLIAAPILELLGAARRVSDNQDYGIRAERRSQDELGQLVDGFNEMLQQIQRRDHELQEHRDHLEEEVAKRNGTIDGGKSRTH